MLSSARRFRGRGPVVLSILLLALVAAGCGAGSASGPGLGPVGQAPGATGASGPLSGGNFGGEGEGEGNGNNEDPELLQGREGLLIIKNGSLAIQVVAIDEGITAANQQITGLGGYSSASERSGDEESTQATVTYRIPAARWDEALAILRGLGEKVIAERYSTDDVTSQVVDLGARIANLQATETALQGIMDRAVEIEDVLRVQAELTKVRSEIEQLTAQKSSLEGRAAFSTLAVTFALRLDPILAEQQGFDPANEVEQASASLVSVLQGLATAGIWFGIVWLPILLALAIVVGIIVFFIRRLSRRIATPGDAPPAPLPSAGG
jgi:hypothetical protein